MENNYLAMCILHSEQTEIWTKILWEHIRNKKIESVTFKSKLIALKDAAIGFNKVAQTKEQKELTADVASKVSRFNELLAKSNKKDGDTLLATIDFLLKNSEINYHTQTPQDLQEKIKLISEINDKLINFDLKPLKRLHKQVINTPLKNEKV